MSQKIVTPLSIKRSSLLGRVLSVFLRVASLVIGVFLCISGASIMFMPDFAVGIVEQLLKVMMGLSLFAGGFVVAMSSSKKPMKNVNFDPTYGEFYQVHDRSTK